MSTTSIEKHILEELYYEKKLTKEEIAKQLGVNRKSVQRACSIYEMKNIDHEVVTERIQSELHQVDPKLTLLSYTNSSKPVSIQCSCGNPFSRRISHMRNSQNYHCPSCRKEKFPQKPKTTRTFEDVQQMVILNNPEAELLHFTSTTKPLTIICSCGNPFTSTYKRVKDTKTCLCPSCTPSHASRSRLSKKTIISYLKEYGCQLGSPFETTKKPITVICSCGTGFDTTFLTFKRKIFKACPDCTEKRNLSLRRTSTDEVRERLKEKGVAWLSGQYKDKDSKLLVTCSACETPYTSSVHSVYQGNRVLCSSCTKSKSTFEHLFEEYLNELNIPYLFNRSKEGATSASGSKLRFDFILYPKKEKPIMIEIDGLQHFKSINAFHKDEEAYLKQKNNDSLKNEFCKENGIPLIRISYRMISSHRQFLLLKKNLTPLLKKKPSDLPSILFYSPLNSTTQIEDYPINHLAS